VLLALMAVLLGMALVVDRAWVDGARAELTTAADAAALAAARELATDDALRRGKRPREVIDRARRAARGAAEANFSGELPLLPTDEDIRFGKLVRHSSSGQELFLETHSNPKTVAVRVVLGKSRSNPLARLFQGFNGSAAADVTCLAEATVNSAVVGVRPLDRTDVPALPLAILESDPTGRQHNVWNEEIDQRRGTDAYGYDPQSGKVRRGPDGIPEITLIAPPTERLAAGDDPGNVRLVDFQGRYSEGLPDSLFTRGWSRADLAAVGGELRLPERQISVAAARRFGRREWQLLRASTGACRICLLYRAEANGSTKGLVDQVRLVGLAAGRILATARDADGTQRVVFQPGVVITPCALLAQEQTQPQPRSPQQKENPFIARLTLTH
jgi:hypothetical protein